jgi:hypothetical protein
MRQLSFLILGCFLSGCGFIISDLNMISTGNVAVQASDEEKLRFETARQLIGKTKQDVMNEFGTNMKVSRKTGLALSETMPSFDSLHPLLEANLIKKSGINSYYRVDEVGFYKYDNGITMVMPDEYGVYFYFIDNICVYVLGS